MHNTKYTEYTQMDWKYKYAEYQEYRMNTDGLKTADNWQATGVEEWPELDFFLSGGFAHCTVLY